MMNALRFTLEQVDEMACQSVKKITAIKLSLNAEIEKMADSNQKLSKVEIEMEHTISIMSIMLADLKNRDKELITIQESTPNQELKISAIMKILNPLKAIKFQQQFVDATKSEFETDNGNEDIDKYETLYDFVNSKCVDDLCLKAKESYDLFIKSYDSLKYSINYLISTIEKIFEGIFRVNQQIDVVTKDIKRNQAKYADVEKKANDIYMQISHVDNPFANDPSQESSNEKQQLAEKVSVLLQNAEEISHFITEYLQEYFKQLAKKKKHYSTLITSAPQVKEKLQVLEQGMSNFEASNTKLKEIYSQCDSLCECYTKFGSSYYEFLKEINRRKKYEEDVDKELAQYRKLLLDLYDIEYNKRIEFRDTCERHLPLLLHAIVKEAPIKYEIYPVTNWSFTSKLSYTIMK